MHKQIKRIAIKITCNHDAILLSRIFDNLLKVVKNTWSLYSYSSTDWQWQQFQLHNGVYHCNIFLPRVQNTWQIIFKQCAKYSAFSTTH